MVTIRKIEKTTVYQLFSLFVQFSAIENRLVFPQAKFMQQEMTGLSPHFLLVYDKLITMTGKKLRGPCPLVRYSHFSTDRAQCQGKSAIFLTCARTR